MSRSRRLATLMLDDVHVTAVGHGGATVRHVNRCLPANSVDRANVVFIHVGENDHGRQRPYLIAYALVSLAERLIKDYGVRTVVISELVHFPVHGRSQWCREVNSFLRRFVAEMDHPGILLWQLCLERSDFDRRGVHVAGSRMDVYWRSVRRAVMTGLGRR